MRLVIFFFLSITFFSLHAQMRLSDEPPRLSIAGQVTNGTAGGFAEFFVKPRVSAWASFSYSQLDRFVGFGVDSASQFLWPLEDVRFKNVQQRTTVRAGVRIYGRTRKPNWSVWYSPVIGYTNYSGPDLAYIEALERDDVNSVYSSIGKVEAKRVLELGGEVGLRWSFWRKLYLEGSTLALGSRSLLGDRTDPVLGFGLRGGLGINF